MLPPGPQVIAGLLGLACWLRWRRLGFALLAVSVLSLWLLSTPLVAGELAALLEPPGALDLEAAMARHPQAIVVLGGGRAERAPELGGLDDVSDTTLERLLYGARLQRLTGLPLAVTGGSVGAVDVPEAVLMTTVLESDFDVPVAWAEVESRNTAENALSSARRWPFRRVLLVTHAIHMPRAARAFREAGFEVIPAPLRFISRPAPSWSARDLLPDGRALGDTRYVFYECFGALWYWFRSFGSGGS